MIDHPFFQQPYLQRQLILVLDEPLIAAWRQIKSTRDDQLAIARHLEDTLRTMTPPVSLSRLSILAAASTLLAYRDAREDGIDLHLVAHHLAAQLHLPPGHPRERVVYAAHPLLPTTYVPLAHFHRDLFYQKYLEARCLLLHLGATSLTVEHLFGWHPRPLHPCTTCRTDTDDRVLTSQEHDPRDATDQDADDEDEDEDCDGTQDVSTAPGSPLHALLQRTTFDNIQPATLPASLVWYPTDLGWQHRAQERLRFGARTFLLHLTYRDDFGITDPLLQQIIEADLDPGGVPLPWSPTAWRLSGEFISTYPDTWE